MKNHLPILLLQVCLIILFSCNQTAEKQSQSVEKKVEKIEKSAKEGSWLQELIATEALTEEVLLSKFPKNLAGLPLRSSGPFAPQTAIGTYSTSPDPNHETENIRIQIVDGAGNYGFGHLNAIHKMISMKVNNQETNGWAKTLDHNGNRILLKESIDKGIESSQVEYIKDKRYHITLTGLRMKSEQLLNAMDDLEKTNF